MGGVTTGGSPLTLFSSSTDFFLTRFFLDFVVSLYSKHYSPLRNERTKMKIF